MAEVQTIHPADLRTIENNLKGIYDNIHALNNNVDVLNGNINIVDQNVKVVYDELGTLAKEFRDYVELAGRQHNLSVAETRLIKVRQELENKYGHYAEVRRSTTGILQANDLGIVKKDTISNITEELMITTPDYWLAPCLVALAAWIADERELADKALDEAIKRNDEKTSLLFALICRRAGRKDASLNWTRRYLENQDEENLNRKAIIILDAFASGLLGVDSEGIVSRQVNEWMKHLSEKPGFIEKQTQEWENAINLKQKPLSETDYVYLRQYSKTWPMLQEILEGANLHATIFNYFEDIFEQEISTESVKKQLDGILMSLVSDFDDEELPLRKEEMLNQLIVNFQGDLNRAQKNMKIEESAFETHKDFAQLLTDAAMKPEASHSSPSTQKFSIALSKEWIINAYNQVVIKNRAKIPNEIEVNIGEFNDRTADGENEQEMIEHFKEFTDKAKEKALEQNILTGFEEFLLYGGGVLGIVGLIMMFTGSITLGFFGLFSGIVMVIYHFSRKKTVQANRQQLEEQFEHQKENGIKIIRALMAEVVDFRREYAEKDKDSQKVLDFLDQISPEQYIKKVSGETRRVRMEGKV